MMTDLFEAETATTTTLDMRRLQRNKRRATRRKWTVVVSSFALVVFALGGSFAWNFVKTFEGGGTAVADYEGTGQGDLQVVVKAGDTGADIATTLLDSGVIASRQAFLTEWNANPDSQGIVPGFYLLHREMKAEYALQSLLDPNTRDLRRLTVPEGASLATFKQKITAITGASDTEVTAAMEDTKSLGLPAEAKGSLEGWLFPSTYEFNPGVTPKEVLKRMIETTVQKLDDLDVPEKDREKVLKVASLVEKEAKLDVDRAKIASVIYNRLEDGMPLQFDSTIKYIKPSEGVFTSPEDRKIDSPYNTYLYPGLPPTPIASPGDASLEAAVNPAKTGFLYFTTVNLDTGKTKYAKTYLGHQKNVKELQRWAQAHKSN